MFFSNDRKVIGELIEQLFNKIKKVDYATKILQKSIKDIVNCFIFKSTTQNVRK